MHGRVIWLALLAVLLVLAGGGTGRVLAAPRHHASPCAAMVMAADHIPAHAPKQTADGCGTCGIGCPMHCAAIGIVPVSTSVSPSGRVAYPPRLRADAIGCPPHAEHGPPRPLA